MPRNVAKPLSASDTMRQRRANHMLPETGEFVVLTYVKRNGEPGTAEGPVQFINGKPGFDTGSVTVDTVESKGRPTTVNMHLIDTINGEAV